MFDPANLSPGTLVIFGRGQGEKTLGKILYYLPRSGKYKVEQLEARGSHAVGTPWTIPASSAFLSEYTGPAPKVVTTPVVTPVVVKPTVNPSAFARAAQGLGLPVDCLGKTFTFKGSLYRITDVRLNRPKFPVDAARVKDSAPFKFNVNSVLSGLGLPVTPKTLTVVTGLLVPNRIGTQFKFSGVTYEVTDYTPSRPKFPYTAKRVSDGRLFKFAEESVTLGAINTPATTKRTDAAILADIRGVYNQLSPENLTWDGERSRAEVTKASRILNDKLRTLFAEIGREVSESEAYKAA